MLRKFFWTSDKVVWAERTLSYNEEEMDSRDTTNGIGE